jgi:hypothetical protein
MTTALQTWIALIAGFATALLGILKYFDYKSGRDRLALVGEHFGQTVEALGSQDQVKRLECVWLSRSSRSQASLCAGRADGGAAPTA